MKGETATGNGRALERKRGRPVNPDILTLALGNVGLGSNPTRAVLVFRRHLERSVLSVHGPDALLPGTSKALFFAMRVRTAAVCLAEAKRAQAKLAKHEKEPFLTEEQQMAWSDRAARHQAAADRVLEALGLNPGQAKDPYTLWLEQAQRQAAMRPASPPASPEPAGRADGQASGSDAVGAKPEAPRAVSGDMAEGVTE